MVSHLPVLGHREFYPALMILCLSMAALSQKALPLTLYHTTNMPRIDSHSLSNVSSISAYEVPNPFGMLCCLFAPLFSFCFRSRVVQAGALEVVGCILEAWLAGRGWGVGGAIGPPGASSSTTGSYRESTHSSSGSRRRRRDRGGGDRIERDQTRTERPAALDDVNIRPPREPEEMTPTSTVTPATVRNYVGAALAARTYAEQVQALARTRSGTIVLSNVEATPTTTSHPALLPRPTTAPTDTGSSINTTTPEASETEDDSDHVNMLAETPPRALNESEDVDMSRSPSPSPLFRTGRGVGNPLDRLPAAAGEGPTTGTDVEIAGMGAMLGLGGIAMEPAFGLGIGEY